MVRYNCAMKMKYPTSVRLTEEAKILLRALADQQGISMGDMLEILIRDAARHANLGRKIEKNPPRLDETASPGDGRS